MKKILKIFSIIILLISATIINSKVSAMLPLSGKIIIIDPGHGGKDPGSITNDTYESTINLEISKKLQIELIKNGAEVILTRDGNYDLSSPNAKWRKKSDFDNRINLINNSNANIYLSIHLNYLTNPNYYGPQVFYQHETDKKLANIIQTKLNTQLNTNREIKKIPSRTYMYDKLKINGVLIECGFLSNQKELENLKNSNYQKTIATIIKDALIEYF